LPTASSGDRRPMKQFFGKLKRFCLSLCERLRNWRISRAYSIGYHRGLVKGLRIKGRWDL